MVDYIERTKDFTITTHVNVVDQKTGHVMRQAVPKRYRARVTIDADAIALELGTKAARNKSGRARLMGGSINVIITNI